MAELNQLEQVLAAPDAIMEPNILEILKRYMKDGGNPATAVEMLCDGYAGSSQQYAHQMQHAPQRRGCGCLTALGPMQAMRRWLAWSWSGRESCRTRAVLQSSRRTRTRRTSCGCGWSLHSQRNHAGEKSAIIGIWGMQELAKKYFDPDKFTGIFTGGGGGPPKWLDGAKGLLADRSGHCLVPLAGQPSKWHLLH